MKKAQGLVLLGFLVGIGMMNIGQAAEDSLRFDVPRLDGIVIDGQAEDWGEQGFKVSVLTDTVGVQKHPEDFDAAFRLGWDAQGLLVLMTVKDDVTLEHEEPAYIWLWDSVELFLGAAVGENKDYFQAVVSPGVTEGQPQLRTQIYDWRIQKDEKELSVDLGRSAVEGGYRLEARLPWSNLGISPSLGDEVGFQVFINDVDEAATNFAGRFQLQWYSRWTRHGSNWMHKLRLGREASPAMRVSARGAYFDRGATRLYVAADPDLAGEAVAVYDGDKELGATTLIDVQDRCQGEVILPTPARGTAYGLLELRAGDKPVGATHIRTESKTVEDLEFFKGIEFERYCFTAKTFPRVDFRYPRQARDVLGEYHIRTTVYDNDYNEVVLADKVGRYGAVVEVTAENGPPIRRNFTLVRVPVELDEYWPSYDTDALPRMEFPEAYGISDSAEQAMAAAIGLHAQILFARSMQGEKRTAKLLGTLYDGPVMPFEGSVQASLEYGNAKWWIGLLRKLDGRDVVAEVKTPQTMQGETAPMLREGSAEEAGFAPDTVERVDALCREWVEAVDEGMGLLVARNGIIVFHRAYGERDGEPVTLDRPLPLASTGKTFAATCLMMLVDQGLVELTAPISDYLPELRGSVYDEAPVSVRSVFTHTSGVPGPMWDHEYSIANEAYRALDLAPVITPHQRHDYSGICYMLGDRVIERMSGKTIAEYNHEHLVGPLGLKHTTLPSHADESTAYDIAVLGQMLLNGGAYGDKRFMGPETVEMMQPTPLSWVDGEEKVLEWGIGTTCEADLDAGQFSASTYGHDGASGALLRIDPENKLVVTGVRSKPSVRSDEYRAKFFRLVHESLIDPAPVVEKPQQSWY